MKSIDLTQLLKERIPESGGLLIGCNGRMIPIEPSVKEKGFNLQELYNALGCDLVEIVYPERTVESFNAETLLFSEEDFDNELIIICDEEGRIKGTDAELNLIASSMYNYGQTPTLGKGFMPICGDVIVCLSKSFK